jgi:hypothetical protein
MNSKTEMDMEMDITTKLDQKFNPDHGIIAMERENLLNIIIEMVIEMVMLRRAEDIIIPGDRRIVDFREGNQR